MLHGMKYPSIPPIPGRRRSCTRFAAGLLLAALLSHSAPAALSLPAVLSDHALLQAGKPVAIWGWAAPGDEVSVSFTATAGADGRWGRELPPVADGAAGELEVRTKTEGPIKIADLLAGEVWLCGGQSRISTAGPERSTARSSRATPWKAKRSGSTSTTPKACACAATAA